MEAMRGQNGIQMLLTAEQEAQQTVLEAKNKKLARLRQAKKEADDEIAQLRSHLESEYQKSISEESGNSDSVVKRLETDVEAKKKTMKKLFSKNSPAVVAKLAKYIASAKA